MSAHSPLAHHRVMSRSLSRGPASNHKIFVASKCLRQYSAINQQLDGRNRLSRIWSPYVPVFSTSDVPKDGHSLLVSTGFIHQPKQRAGVFHYLPLGLRVLEKIEQLLDKHMLPLGASKLALSSITHTDVWQKSERLKGKLEDGDHELVGLLDRKRSGLMLSPTHEEEITMLVQRYAPSHQDLPLRLYQISRKYRDELRPRAGLLRAKEFIMKDLYSFDLNADKAMETYNEVRKAYDSFFTELGAPFIVAEADSGNMGGNLSHEYHYESPLGEDIVWTCSNCTYVANDEVVFRKSTERPTNNQSDNHQAKIWRGITIDRTANVTVIYPTNDIKNTKGSLGALDSTMLKQIYPQIDLTIKSLSPNAPEMVHQIVIKHPQVPNKTLQDFIDLNLISGNALQIATEKDFLRTKDGDLCPRCETGLLRSHHTIELGHTFFLGTRYSNPFRLAIVDPNSVHGGNVSPNIVQMGCYGIGVSRLIGALAEIGTREITFGTRKTQYGLNWPTPVAPFEVAIIYNMDDHSREAQRIYDSLCVPIAANAPVPDVVLDDRARGIPWKLTDADMRGYPVLLILGNKMPEYVEVQCKALGLKALVSPYDLKKHVYSALHSLKQNYLSPQKGSKPVKTLQFGPGMEKVEMAQMAEIAEMPRSDSTSEVNLSREKALNRHRLKPTKDERIVKTADGGLVEVRRFTPAIIRGYETSKGKRGGIS